MPTPPIAATVRPSSARRTPARARSMGPLRQRGIDTPARIFEKIVRLAGPAEIREVWVAGRVVAGTAGPAGPAGPP